MANLKAIKNRIASVDSTRQITKAMRMVAAAKLRKAQERMHNNRPYAERLQQLMLALIQQITLPDHPLFAEREVKRVLLVVVTSDRGLCGGFNSNILRRAAALIDELREKYEVEVYAVGRKGYDFFRKRDYHLARYKTGVFAQLDYALAKELSLELSELFATAEYDRIYGIFNEFKSALQQRQISEMLLPLSALNETTKTPAEPTLRQVEPLYDPDRESILRALIPRHLSVQVWRYLVESNAAEEAARMAAMESATDNANEMIDDLTIIYNRSRQAAITTEIAEIVGGAEALKG
jgi:F-type H+-transporting ATPase subunit gamma